MRISDIPHGARFGFVHAARYFGKQRACVWTKIDEGHIQQDGCEPVRISDAAAEIYVSAFPVAKKTTRSLRLPVYEGPACQHEFDWRVQTEDGTICYVWKESTGNEPALVLCTELVALDSGNNIVRRRKASEGNRAGLAAPAVPRTAVTLFVCPADGSILGYYRVV